MRALQRLIIDVGDHPQLLLWPTAIAIVFLAALCARCSAQAPAQTPLIPGGAPNRPPRSSSMEIGPRETRWFNNPDGSCVQCSGGMVGVANNNLAWSTLLWPTVYGPAERGGSGPGRVARYARARGMRLYNVTGAATYPMIEWAARTGRYAAIGAGAVHFQTFYGRDFQADLFFVCNNNSTQRVDVYTPQQFRRLHQASGEWMFCPDAPSCAPPPRLVAWWTWPTKPTN